MTRNNTVVAVGARNVATEIEGIVARRRKNAQRQRKVVIEIKVEPVGETGIHWCLWLTNGRPDYGASVKCSTKREAMDTAAVMKREAVLVQECTCGRRSPIMGEHADTCGALTAKRVVKTRHTQFALRAWITRQCYEYVSKRYDEWQASRMAGGSLKEPHVTGGVVACWLMDSSHSYAAALRALGLEQAAETCACVMREMKSLQGKGKGASERFVLAR